MCSFSLINTKILMESVQPCCFQSLDLSQRFEFWQVVCSTSASAWARWRRYWAMRRSAWESANALASNKSCRRPSLDWRETQTHLLQKLHLLKCSSEIRQWAQTASKRETSLGKPHRKRSQLLLVDLNDVRHVRVLHLLLQLPAETQRVQQRRQATRGQQHRVQNVKPSTE